MRKKLLIFILLFLFPIVINAEPCEVVNGTGNDLGDEIACGSEHFYIIEKNDTTTKMVAKYNLYVGDKIDKDDMTFTVEEYGDADDALYAAYEHCIELESTYGEGNVETTGKYSEDGEASEYFCRIYTPLEYEKVKQDELAIGLYPNGNKEVVYPVYGSVYLDVEGGDEEFDENLDMIPETSQFNTYFNRYKETLSELGLNVLDIGFIKRSGIENFINSVSENKITIPVYNPDDESMDPEDSEWESSAYFDYDIYFSKINIKDNVPEKYKWLYGTTYWVGSATLYVFNDWSEYYDEFLTTIGDYCSYSRGCHYTKIGVGLRPVILINNEDIFIEEEEEQNTEIEEVNPKTLDNIDLYLVLCLISTVGLISSKYLLKKEN